MFFHNIISYFIETEVFKDFQSAILFLGQSFSFFVTTHAGKIYMFLFPRICHIHLYSEDTRNYLVVKKSHLWLQKIDEIKYRYFNAIMFDIKISYDNFMRKLVII